MNPQRRYERLLASLHAAALDETLWPTAAKLTDEACGATGSSVIAVDRAGDDRRVSFAAFWRRGERRFDLERDYYENYYRQDERVPRIERLRDGKLVRAAGLFRPGELRTSATWNEAMPRAGTRNGLIVRLGELHGLRVTWVIADPVTGDWESGQIRMIRRLFPHIRHLVSVRKALADAKASGSSLVHLLDSARLGVIHLDRRGRIVELNDCARDLLRQGDGLWEQHGFLRAWRPGDDAQLKGLVAAALPAVSGQATGGSVLVRHPRMVPGLTLHVQPVARQMVFGAPAPGVLVLIEGLDRPLRIDAGLVASVLGLTLLESRVAVLLAEGRTVPDVAVLTGRAPTTVRTHLRRVHRKLGVSRRADLVRLVLSVPERAGFWRRP